MCQKKNTVGLEVVEAFVDFGHMSSRNKSAKGGEKADHMAYLLLD